MTSIHSPICICRISSQCFSVVSHPIWDLFALMCFQKAQITLSLWAYAMLILIWNIHSCKQIVNPKLQLMSYDYLSHQYRRWQESWHEIVSKIFVLFFQIIRSLFAHRGSKWVCHWKARPANFFLRWGHAIDCKLQLTDTCTHVSTDSHIVATTYPSFFLKSRM